MIKPPCLWVTAALMAVLNSCAAPEKKNPLFDFDNHEAAGQLTLVSDGFLEIPVDSLALNFSYYPAYFDADTAELYIDGNDFTNAIDFYNLGTQRRVQQTVFPRNVVEGTLSTRKFYVKSLDSIYILPDANDQNEVILANHKGKILQRYNRPWKPWFANLLQPMMVRGDEIYFGNMNYGDSREQPGHRALVRYNMVTYADAEFGPYYPEEYRTNAVFHHGGPTHTFGPDNNVVVRYCALPFIYNYDMAKDSTTIFPMKSRFQEKAIMPDTLERDREFDEVEQELYSGVYYDPYRQVYYSIFYPAIPKTDQAGNLQSFDDRPIVVMIFNRRFEYCGEVRLKERTYFRNFISSKRGLLVPTAHPKNPMNDESKIRFEIFRLQPVH